MRGQRLRSGILHEYALGPLVEDEVSGCLKRLSDCVKTATGYRYKKFVDDPVTPVPIRMGPGRDCSTVVIPSFPSGGVSLGSNLNSGRFSGSPYAFDIPSGIWIDGFWTMTWTNTAVIFADAAIRHVTWTGFLFPVTPAFVPADGALWAGTLGGTATCQLGTDAMFEVNTHAGTTRHAEALMIFVAGEGESATLSSLTLTLRGMPLTP